MALPKTWRLAERLVVDLEKVVKKAVKAGPKGLEDARFAIQEIVDRYENDHEDAVKAEVLADIKLLLER